MKIPEQCIQDLQKYRVQQLIGNDLTNVLASKIEKHIREVQVETNLHYI